MHSSIQNAVSTTALQAISSHHFPSFSQHFSIFTPLFHSRTSKFTTITTQFPFYNCKLHYTTAEIVIRHVKICPDAKDLIWSMIVLTRGRKDHGEGKSGVDGEKKQIEGSDTCIMYRINYI